MSEHRARYKNTALNPTELRRRREEGNIKLRKQKRDDVLSNKRRLHQTDPITDELEATILDSDDQFTPKDLEDLKQNQDLNRILDSARRIRKCLSKEPDPPFDEVIKCGILPRLLELLDYHSSPSIQFEVTWILTNISSSVSEHTRAVVESGVVPKLIQLLKSNDPKLQEQALWALGNIIGDGTEFRDIVIKCGFIPPFLEAIKTDVEVSFLKNSAWVIVNLSRFNDPPIDLDTVKLLLPKIKTLLTVMDNKVLIDTTWAVSYIIELGPDYFDLMLDRELIERMKPLLESEESRLITSTVRAFGCMAAGLDEQTQLIINAGVLPLLNKALIMNHNMSVGKDILWLISNVAAGTQEQVQELIDAGLVTSIIHYLMVGDFYQQMEATWGVFNLTITGTTDQLEVLVKEQAVPALCDLLTLTDPTILKKALESLKNLLQKFDQVAYQIEQCSGLDKIESLQNSPNEEIYELAYAILDSYFSHNDLDK